MKKKILPGVLKKANFAPFPPDQSRKLSGQDKLYRGFDKYLVINKSPLGDLGANVKTGLLQQPLEGQAINIYYGYNKNRRHGILCIPWAF